MKRVFLTLLILIATLVTQASSIFFESFEYANHDGEIPMGWTCANESWLCGYLDKDHNRVAHTGDWYAYTNSAESWMFMPMFMSEQLKYRFNLWAISDGGYQLEIWAGNEASSSSMTQLLLSDIVSSGSYEQFSAYIDEMTSNYQYFGIHAVQSYCGDCILTIDDINVDMVDKYGLLVTPETLETNLAPEMQTDFHFKFINVGYEPLTVYVTPISEHFSDIHVFANGVEGPTFHADPDEIVEISGIATLMPDNPIGSLCWIDIMFTLDCGCATAMFTYWATVATDNVEEEYSSISVYPNPSNGSVTIDGTGIITILNTLGQEILRKQIIGKETVTLESGVYFVKINDRFPEKLIVK